VPQQHLLKWAVAAHGMNESSWGCKIKIYYLIYRPYNLNVISIIYLINKYQVPDTALEHFPYRPKISKGYNLAVHGMLSR
jgi:hypothetical protein